MFDLIILILPFLFLSIAVFAQAPGRKIYKVISRKLLGFISLLVAMQTFCQLAITINGYRRSTAIMSTGALEILKQIENEQIISLAYLYERNDFVIAYSAIFLIPFFFLCYLFYRGSCRRDY